MIPAWHSDVIFWQWYGAVCTVLSDKQFKHLSRKWKNRFNEKKYEIKLKKVKMKSECFTTIIVDHLYGAPV